MGDKFEHISNSSIATRGSIIATQGAIVQGVNTLSQQGNEDVAKAISELEALISKAPETELPDEKKAESLELLKGVVEEAAKPGRDLLVDRARNDPNNRVREFASQALEVEDESWWKM